MNAFRRKPTEVEQDAVAQQPQTPPGVGYGASTHDFTLQAIMELQKSVGEMNATLVNLKGSIDGVKGKVDDLVNWKHKILGGAAVFGVVVAALTFVITKASDYVTIRVPAPAAVQVAPATTPLPPQTLPQPQKP